MAGTGADKEAISEMTTGRLSVYLRCLNFLESQDQKTISSHELADRFHLNSAQIRKDLAHFGEFGIRGVGYNISLLKAHLIRTLGIDIRRKVVIAGAGNLGLALADYHGFNAGGFEIVALVDTDPRKIGQSSRSGIEIRGFEGLGAVVEKNQVEIGVIAVPAEEAQSVYETLVDAGICAILNFAPVQLRARSGVKLRSVDLRINLESLSFYLANRDEMSCVNDPIDTSGAEPPHKP
ncbi:MAG TPA: redox-sensing transcriptional repressor Rex [Thermoanaerobaculia bacterium]|nr:redox-sensing transcriptional repressor Rex [Thermoanaerobaculia bacterium]